jgi:hypothetical protein
MKSKKLFSDFIIQQILGIDKEESLVKQNIVTKVISEDFLFYFLRSL